LNPVFIFSTFQGIEFFIQMPGSRSPCLAFRVHMHLSVRACHILIYLSAFGAAVNELSAFQLSHYLAPRTPFFLCVCVVCLSEGVQGFGHASFVGQQFVLAIVWAKGCSSNPTIATAKMRNKTKQKPKKFFH